MRMLPVDPAADGAEETSVCRSSLDCTFLHHRTIAVIHGLNNDDCEMRSVASTFIYTFDAFEFLLLMSKLAEQIIRTCRAHQVGLI